MGILLTIVLGFLALRFWIAFYNWLSRPYFAIQNIPASTVKLSVLIPARNESNSISAVVTAVLASKEVDFELIVLDDHSEDDTADLVTLTIAGDPRARLIKGDTLPEAWLGKSWACHQLAIAATGDWLVYIDADVLLSPDALRQALATIEKQKLDALSVFPYQQMNSLGEWLTVPLMHQLLLSLLPLKFIRWFKSPALAAANGQFLILRTSDYREMRWHEQVKNEIVEDIAIFRAMKGAGKKVMTLTDPYGEIRCRMYVGLKQGIAGFSKNVLSGFGNSIVLLFLYLFLTAYSWPLLWWLGARFEFVGLGLIVLAIRLFVSLSAGQGIAKNVALHIPQLLVFHWIAWKSIYQRLTRQYEWKGRKLR